MQLNKTLGEKKHGCVLFAKRFCVERVLSKTHS